MTRARIITICILKYNISIGISLGIGMSISII